MKVSHELTQRLLERGNEARAILREYSMALCRLSSEYCQKKNKSGALLAQCL